MEKGIYRRDAYRFFTSKFIYKKLAVLQHKWIAFIFGALLVVIVFQVMYTIRTVHTVIKNIGHFGDNNISHTLSNVISKFGNFRKTKEARRTNESSSMRKNNVSSTMRKNKVLSTMRNGMKINCTEKFKSGHLMTHSIGGRLGNRIFLVGNLIVAANDTCYTPFLKNPVGLGRFFDLRYLKIAYMEVNTSNFKNVREEGWGKFDMPIAKKISTNHNWTIRGVRQSHKYLQHKKELVRSSFVFKKAIRETVAKYFEDNHLTNRTKVGVHVRRSDFTTPHNLQKGYVVSSLYYIVDAMAYLKYHLPGQNLVFIVVSDDIPWCKEAIKAPNTYFSPFNHQGKDLHLLTQCDHNIITSGSFGWMGAWLNETGIVIYDKSFPKYNSTLWKRHRKEDYYPDWWIGL